MCIHDRNRFTGKFFYILDICLLFNVAEGNSPSAQPGPSGSSDAVDICLRNIGKIKVNDTGEFFDIDAPGCDIRSHQDLNLARFKMAQGRLSGSLGFISVNSGGAYPVFY